MVRDFQYFVDRPTLRTRNSAYLENNLLNLKGQHWKNVRALITPTFSSGKLKFMENMVDQCAVQMTQFLHKSATAKNGTAELEMKHFFGRFTLDVIGTCAFGVQCDSLKDEEAEFVKITSRFNELSLPYRMFIFVIILFVPQLARFIPINFINSEVMTFLVDVVKNTKDYRMKHKEERRNDFLQLMMDAAEEDTKQNQNSKQSNNTVLDEDTIIAQSILFLLAGFETSSTLLTCMSYELALNQDIQDKLREEVKHVLDRHDGKCSYEALQEMTYLEMIILESLRKYPPIARVDRVCTQPYTIPGTDITLETETSVSISIMGLHNDPQYYPQPEVFDPDRFLPETKNSRSPYVFLPFGSGPRNCIGLRFAMMSTKLAMAHLIREFRLERSEKTEVPFKYSRFSMFLKAQNGIWLNVRKI
ncbi:hypothetical protein L9F63_006921 [Diploptera punctata]|uniref:Cytochrome P450 n=1 Tax=Diploptera punctata TaxID=6984 RepID=A0AAD7Z9Z9_DIPPU|nr:hypothetical protein L9F63_006921 [Diploptera punctata]